MHRRRVGQHTNKMTATGALCPIIDKVVRDELYEKLRYTASDWPALAFERDGKFYFDEKREDLLYNLIARILEKHPEFSSYVKDTYLFAFTPSEFIPLLKLVWIHCSQVFDEVQEKRPRKN